jgi:hypothetical protein
VIVAEVQRSQQESCAEKAAAVSTLIGRVLSMRGDQIMPFRRSERVGGRDVAIGGQAGTSSRIDNYMGFPTGISGADCVWRGEVQAMKFGAQFATPRRVAKLERLEGGQRSPRQPRQQPPHLRRLPPVTARG